MDDTYKLQSAEESRFLSRRLWILLWLVIISTVTDFFSDTNFMNELPALYWPCLVLNVLCFWAYALVLLDMGSVSGYYKTAGILHLVCGGIGVLIIILSGTRALSLALYLSYSVMVLSVIAAYNEFRGHSEELLYLDPELSAGWMRLWKWFWILMAVIIAAAVLSPLLPFLSSLSILASGAGVVIIAVLRLVYLNRSAKRFDEHAASMGQ